MGQNVVDAIFQMQRQCYRYYRPKLCDTCQILNAPSSSWLGQATPDLQCNGEQRWCATLYKGSKELDNASSYSMYSDQDSLFDGKDMDIECHPPSIPPTDRKDANQPEIRCTSVVLHSFSHKCYSTLKTHSPKLKCCLCLIGDFNNETTPLAAYKCNHT